MRATQTGMGVSFMKAVGMLYPKEKRLFEDPYSEKFLNPFYKFFIFLMRSPKVFDSLMKFREKATPGLVGWMFCRFRYIDDVLKENIAKKEIESVINLGVGMDCRAFYIPGIEGMRYFEVDHPSVIKTKKAKLENILGKLPDYVVYVPIDFEKQALDTELKKAGYNLGSKTLFICEGVTQYISKEANDSILKYVAQAAPGSKIVFTYILRSFIEGKDIPEGLQLMYKQMRRKNNPLWIYGLDPTNIANYLSKFSLSLIEDIGSADVEQRYMKLVDLDLKVLGIERIALTEVNR
jgi:methyltransferase (TIGR00027 family)